MTKKEIIWRQILYQAITKKEIKFRQKDLAEKFGFSLSTVFNALKIPRELGAVEVTGRDFRMRDMEKFLYIWATHRKINKEAVYKTHSPKNVREIESEMPAGVVFGAYSAYVKKYKDAPADYDKVYVYADENELTEITKRFPEEKGYENLFVLKKDPWLDKFGSVTPAVQTFIDLWNLSDWYAKEFINSLKKKLFN